MPTMRDLVMISATLNMWEISRIVPPDNIAASKSYQNLKANISNETLLKVILRRLPLSQISFYQKARKVPSCGPVYAMCLPEN